MTKKTKSTLAGACISGFIGLLFFLFLFHETLNPNYTAWIIIDGWDTLQHHIGWEFFRSAPWSFPIGVNKNLAFPVGVPITYTDSIPLIAFPLKLISRFLPQPFQFLGLWTALCFILQGITAYFLLKTKLKDNFLSVLGSIFFIMSPIMLFRVNGHASLSAHWLLLLGLLILFKKTSYKFWQWPTLLSLSIFVHPYILFMNGALFFADLTKQYFVNKTLSLKKITKHFTFSITLILLISYIIGIFYAGSVSDGGFGYFSLNLNALFNPYGWDSPILPDLHWGPGQYEGFAYLGVGMIILLLFSLFSWGIQTVKHTDHKTIQPCNHTNLKQWLNKITSNMPPWPITTVLIILTLFSVSHIIQLNQYTLLSFPLPEIIKEKYLGPFRASARFFWPVYYAILLFSLSFIKKQKKHIATIILIITLSIQIFDFSNSFARLDQKYANKTWNTPLISDQWQAFAKEYTHIAFIPNYTYTIDINGNTYQSISVYAAQNNMTLNTGYIARKTKGLDAHLTDQIKNLQSGTIDQNTLYILPENHTEYTKNIDTTKHPIINIDNFTILAPKK